MQGQRETNASNTSLIDDIYDDIMLNEEKRKKTYNIKDYSIKVVEEKEEEEEVRLQHHDLIDSFIKNEEQRTPGSGLNLDMETTGAPVPGNLAELEENQHKPLDDSYFTETLAHIYVKQKRYEKALQIIKNLNLKYPEKNVYFADQIRFLEKLIINTKK